MMPPQESRQTKVEYRHVWPNGSARSGLTKEGAESLARLYGGQVQARDVTPWREVKVDRA